MRKTVYLFIFILIILLGICNIDTFAALKLTCPNGGEKFIAGSDTLISWEGIAESDTVSLEYSIDNGITWKLITKKATGLNYVWKDLPKPLSNECLVKVKLIKNGASYYTIPDLEWEKKYNEIQFETDWTNDINWFYGGANSVQQTFEGGYVFAGYKLSSTFIDSAGNDLWYDWDIYIVKTDNIGNLEWQKSIYEVNDFLTGQTTAYSIKQTRDSGYILTGEYDNVTWCHYNGHKYDPSYLRFFVIKLDRYGNTQWGKIYNDYIAKSIQQTNDGGYIFAAVDNYSKAGIIKLDSNGIVVWDSDSTNGSSEQYNYRSIKQTSDGGYIAVGELKRDDENFYIIDYLITKLDKNGKLEWQKTYGGSSRDIADCISETADGGFIVSGITESKNRDVKEYKGVRDYWLLKLDRLGSIEWQKTLGGSGDEGFATYYWDNSKILIDNLHGTSSVFQISDSGYIFVGVTKSNDGDVSKNAGYEDVWVVQLDKTGNIKWESTYGGSINERPGQAQPTIDGGFVVTGSSFSKKGEGTQEHYSGMWLLKFGNKTINLPEDISDAVFSIVATEPLAKKIDMKQALLGTPKDSLINEFVINAGEFRFRVDSIYFRGADANAFSIISGLPKYTLEPKEFMNTEFKFTPSRIGIHSAEIVIKTQYDSLIQTIQGEGVAPQIQVLNQVIDFGLVNVGKNKDTLQVVTIKNIGSAPVVITNTEHNKPNDYDFSTLAGGGNFTLNPGDTAKLSLRFKPSALGKTSGTLEFYYDALGSPAVVTLIGDGIKCRAKIEASIPNFKDIICEYNTYESISISNTGKDTLQVKKLNLTGPDKADFSLNELLPINLAPDSSKTISIGFKTNVPGIKTAALEIKSNADPDSVLMIPLTARKDSIALVPNPILIYLGVLFPNQTKDTSFVISNFGTIQTDGKVTYTSNISCVNPTFTVDSGAVFKLDFTFMGISVDGNINEIITVWDEVCKFSREVLITGKVLAPYLQGFSATQCKSYSNEYKLTLQNPSSNRLKITSIEIEKNPQLFIIDPNIVFPITIEPFSTNNEVKVSYKDDSAQNFKTAVNCITDNKFIPVLIDTIYAETVEYKRTTSGLINDTIRNAGNPFAVSYDSESQNGKNKFTYSIQVNESANDMDYLTELSDLEIIINYNRNVLGADFDTQSGNVKVRVGSDLQPDYSIKSAKETEIDEFNSQIIVNLENTGKPITTKNAYKLLEIDFSAYLSNYGLSDEQNSEKSRSAIISHSITTTDKCIEYETANNAILSIEKLCTDDIRSIRMSNDSSAKFYLGAVIPHPIGTKGATIEYGLGFECQVTLTIYDLSGTIILVPINEIQKAGIHKQTISSKSLSTGAYFIEMKAGPFKETKRVIVE